MDVQGEYTGGTCGVNVGGRHVGGCGAAAAVTTPLCVAHSPADMNMGKTGKEELNERKHPGRGSSQWKLASLTPVTCLHPGWPGGLCEPDLAPSTPAAVWPPGPDSGRTTSRVHCTLYLV